MIHVHTPSRYETPPPRPHDPQVFHQATLDRLGFCRDEFSSAAIYGAMSDCRRPQKPPMRAWAKVLSATALAGLLAAAALVCMFSFSSLVAEQREGGRAEAYLRSHGARPQQAGKAALGAALERMKLLHSGLLPQPRVLPSHGGSFAGD